MKQRLRVSADTNGVPRAEVPCTCMWELVEYLSLQGEAVTYQFAATHFTVLFPRQDVRGAQRILDEWTNSPSQLLQTA